MNGTVLITGASRGIGRACALAFGKAGWCVAANYNKSGQEAERLLDELRRTFSVRTYRMRRRFRRCSGKPRLALAV